MKIVIALAIPAALFGQSAVTAFSPKADGIANDQRALYTALHAAPDGASVYFPPGKYAFCTLAVSGKSISLYGAGGAGTLLLRHASCTGEVSPMPSVNGGGSFTMRDLNWDLTIADGDAVPPCFRCMGVGDHDVTADRCDNVCTRSSIAVVPAVDHLTVNGNTVVGAHEHGLREKSDWMFFEGATQLTVTGNHLSNCARNESSSRARNSPIRAAAGIGIGRGDNSMCGPIASKTRTPQALRFQWFRVAPSSVITFTTPPQRGETAIPPF